MTWANNLKMQCSTFYIFSTFYAEITVEWLYSSVKTQNDEWRVWNLNNLLLTIEETTECPLYGKLWISEQENDD